MSVESEAVGHFTEVLDTYDTLIKSSDARDFEEQILDDPDNDPGVLRYVAVRSSCDPMQLARFSVFERRMVGCILNHPDGPYTGCDHPFALMGMIADRWNSGVRFLPAQDGRTTDPAVALRELWDHILALPLGGNFETAQSALRQVVGDINHIGQIFGIDPIAFVRMDFDRAVAAMTPEEKAGIERDANLTPD